MISIVLALLCLLGLTISAYFTAVFYHWMPADARWIPSFCRMEEATCASVVFSPQAKILGPPNSLLGMLYYAALLLAAATGLLFSRPLLYLFLLMSVGTVLLGVYLAYSLLAVLRVPCSLCFTSHALNLLILILLSLGI